MVVPVTKKGNKYAVMFMDLIKWSEVYPTKEQTAPTIIKLLVAKQLLFQDLEGAAE